LASERRACRLLGLSRSMAHYQSCRADDTALRARLRALAEQYPRYGHLTLHDLLHAEGRVIIRKHTYRLYREEGLQVRTKRQRKLVRARVPMPVPDVADERWSVDLVSDRKLPFRAPCEM